MVTLFNYSLEILENLDDLYSFFYKNKHEFKKHSNGENTTNKHADNVLHLKNVFEIEFPYGYCFPISQFIFYYLGGYNNKDINLMCIKKIPVKIIDYNFLTRQGYVLDRKNQVIIDLTKKQGDKI